MNLFEGQCQMCNIYSESLHETIMEHKETKERSKWLICRECKELLIDIQKNGGKKHV
jgi:ATP-dependent protease ClpP protease subunit